MTTRKPMVAAILAAALIALAGCGSADQSGDNSGAPSSHAPSTSAEAAPSATNGSAAPSSEMAMITIKDYKYSGADSVSPGAKVMVMNEDTVNHTVTAEKKSDFNVMVKAGESATFTAPTTPGTYKYTCTFHANMMGTLVVK